jgi:hypothetical protein
VPNVRLNANLLKKLEGSPLDLGTSRFTFEKSPNFLPAARAGGEGYAIPVVHAESNRRFILKTYHLPSPERKTRITFLSSLPLQRLFPTLVAAPAIVVEKDFELPGAAGANNLVRIEGYLAELIEGETFAELIGGGWDPPFDLRLRLAAQLCNSVRVLEGGGLVHGDLSSNNIMVAAPESVQPALELIDFDGFYHSGVPPIPCTEESGGRGWGSHGYRSAAYQAMDETVLVTSDRVAMSALALELVILRPDDLELLERETLLDQVEIDAHNPQLPPEVAARWAEGWALVQRAFAAERPGDAPSPKEWCSAIARLALGIGDTAPVSLSPLSGGLVPMPLLIRESGQPDRRVRLTRASGTFGAVSGKLGWLAYEHHGASVTLRGEASSPLFVRRQGKTTEKHPGVVDTQVESGDTVIWDDFEVLVG